MHLTFILQGVDGDVNIEHFIDDSTFEDWASNMRRNGVFADHVVVLGMARMLETNMLIVTSNPQGSPENCMTHIVGKMNYDGMTINLGHVWENHYYSLISLDGNMICLAKLINGNMDIIVKNLHVSKCLSCFVYKERVQYMLQITCNHPRFLWVHVAQSSMFCFVYSLTLRLSESNI